MSACYVICGFLMGVCFTKWSPEYPQWMFLLLPAAISLLVAIVMDADNKGRNS